MDYADYVGLWLNLERVRARRALDLAAAAAVAAGGPTPDEWVRVLTDTPEEAARWRRADLRRQLRRP